MVVLPEMFASGFTMNVASATDPREETEKYLSDVAKEFEIFVVAGVASRVSEDRGRNEAVVIGPDGREIARYCKLHPFMGEADHYHRGERTVTFDWFGVKVCPLICFDLRFPEAFRPRAIPAAEVFIVIASWPDLRDEHWVTLLRARAIENQAYVVGVNRCGIDPSFRYSGRSMIIDPHGKALADAGGNEGFIAGDVDVNMVRRWRAEFPVLRLSGGGQSGGSEWPR
jgi:predicted amidohydrolase